MALIDGLLGGRSNTGRPSSRCAPSSAHSTSENGPSTFVYWSIYFRQKMVHLLSALEHQEAQQQVRPPPSAQRRVHLLSSIYFTFVHLLQRTVHLRSSIYFRPFTFVHLLSSIYVRPCIFVALIDGLLGKDILLTDISTGVPFKFPATPTVGNGGLHPDEYSRGIRSDDILA